MVSLSAGTRHSKRDRGKGIKFYQSCSTTGSSRLFCVNPCPPFCHTHILSLCVGMTIAQMQHQQGLTAKNWLLLIFLNLQHSFLPELIYRIPTLRLINVEIHLNLFLISMLHSPLVHVLLSSLQARTHSVRRFIQLPRCWPPIHVYWTAANYTFKQQK